MSEKRVYTFGNGKAEGRADMRNLLGGKGANLAEMNLIGIPVPPGFTITTDVCNEYFEKGKEKVVALLKNEVEQAVKHVEGLMKSKFGDVENPLLVSVRSGARASMPGMMDTILNLGLNDEVVEGLARKTGNERFAYDSYRRFVQMYGDVQWEDHVIDKLESEEVYGPRTDRDLVMDKVLEDLNFAIANIPSNTSDKTEWSKEFAEAMKSDVCLYEGTFCKYRTLAENGKAPDLARANRYLQACVDASESLRTSGKFTLNVWTPDAKGKIYTIYNSLDLSSNDEVIFYNNYEKDVKMHGLCDFTSSSTTQRGITKDAVDAFLFKDGRPLATTTLNTNDKAQLDAQGHYSIAHLLQNKDKRLSLLIDPIICFKNHGWIRNEPSPDGPLPAEMTSSTGYTIYKYDNPQLELYYRTNTNTNYTDIPLFWYAVVLLNEAEAKAELGTITQTDLDNTVNLLQTRAELPALTLTPAADPANNMGVSNLIWEIRRTRRCELMCDLDYRYWDLLRWHQLDKLDSNVHPNINRGANVSGVADQTGLTVDGNYLVGTTATRTFLPKYYSYPIPSNDLTLNENPGMKQNIGW